MQHSLKLFFNYSTYKQMLNHVWRTTATAANHVGDLTRKNREPGKFQVCNEGEVQSDDINKFNQHVGSMIKTIEGLVKTDTSNG